MSFTEAQFAGWMTQWTEAVDQSPGWRELTTYRETSAMDIAYLNMYFGLLDWMRRHFDPKETERGTVASPYAVDGRPGGYDGSRGWPSRIAAAARAAAGQTTERWRIRGSPASIQSTGSERTALVIRAARNTTGFPVLSALKDEHDWDVHFASWNKLLRPRVRGLGLPYIDLSDAYGRWCISGARDHQVQVDEALRRLDSRHLSRLFSDISGLPVTVDLGPILRQLCIATRVHVDICFDLLARLRPNLALFFNESTLRERTGVRVAQLCGIATVAIQHGLYIGHVYRPLATDALIVWGRIPRDFWLALGSAPDRVISAGGFGHESSTETDAWRSDAARPVGNPATVLVLGQNPASDISQGTYRASLDALLDGARRLPGVHFVVRPHPAEPRGPYERAIESQRFSNLTLRASEPLHAALRAADVVVTVFSTAGLEAMMLETPVVVLNASAEPSLAPFASVTDVVGDGEELARAIQRLVSDAAYRSASIVRGQQFVQDYVGPVDGGATSRAAAAINRLANLVAVRSRSQHIALEPR